MSLCRVLAAFACALALCGGPSAFAGNYGVSPLDVQFSPQQKTAVLTVTNDDAKPLAIRLRAMRWTQDAAGQDVYEEASDLIFFPKRLDLKPGEKRIVRAGVNDLPAKGERAYRLFLEELAPPPAADGGQTKLAVLVTFGVPVFSAAAGAKAEARIVEARADGATLRLGVANLGSARLRLTRVLLADGTPVSDAVPSRYVFPGITKQFEIPLPKALCRGGQGRLRLEFDAVNAETDIALPAGCAG